MTCPALIRFNKRASSVQFLHEQPHQSRKHRCECRQNESCALGLAYLECRFGNVVVNLTGLEHFHQEEGDDKAHSSPFKASQSQVHRAEGSADDRLAQGPADEISLAVGEGASYARAANSFIQTHHEQLVNTIRAE